MIDKIIEYKKEEIKRLKKKFPLNSFKNKLKKSNRDFKKAIMKNKINLIAEIKKASPSKGLIRKNFNVKQIAEIYDKNNVAAISVLTEKYFFKGNIKFLPIIRKITSKPLLRKDFIIDEYQVYESRYYEADAILLIASILTKEKISKFIKIAKKYNMDCLVEVHGKQELKKLPNNVEIIGINNRNLKNLKVDIKTTHSLIKVIPKNKIIVSESGIKTKKEIKLLMNKVNAVLIGAVLMQSKDINKKINGLGF